MIEVRRTYSSAIHRAKPTLLHHSQKCGTNTLSSHAFPSSYVKCETSELFSISSSLYSSCMLLFFLIISSFYHSSHPFLHLSLLSSSLLSPNPLYTISSLSLHTHTYTFQTLTETLRTLSALLAGTRKWLRPWDLRMRLPVQEMGQYKTAAAPAKPRRPSLVASLSVSVWKRRQLHRKRPPTAISPVLKVPGPALMWTVYCIHLEIWLSGRGEDLCLFSTFMSWVILQADCSNFKVVLMDVFNEIFHQGWCFQLL